MPEFILDTGTAESAKRFRALDSFTRGYIEAMFFTETNEMYDSDEWDTEAAQEDIAEGRCSGSIPRDSSVNDLAPATWDKIIADCRAFQEDNQADLNEALDNGRINGYDDEAAGCDFWYSRNGHGVGYFDRGLGDVGDTLQKAAQAWRQIDLYRGDDGLLYFS